MPSDQHTLPPRPASGCGPLDPVVGLEKVRRSLDLSKAAFYGGTDSPYRQLPIVELSQRRRGVRLSDLERWLAARTRRPLAP
jgi:predicted exporter